MDYNKIAQDIIDNVGGEDNITSAMHCATRLRLTLKNYDLIDEEKLTDIPEVKGVFKAGTQYQIILGSGLVNLVCDEVTKILGFDVNVGQPQEEEKEGSIIQRAVKLLSDIFVPIIPAIVASGLLMGIYNVLTATGLFVDGKSLIDLYPQFADLAEMINIFSNAAFTFLPVLIGYSATKKFGGNPYLGAVMGMIMVHPDLLSAYSRGTGVDIPTWNILGMTVEAVGYQGTVLPVLAVSWILATIEKKLHKVTPTWLDNLTTPLLSVFITGFLTFLFIGPVLRTAGDMLADGITYIYNSLGIFGGLILGLLYAPICITGMHHSFIAIETQLIAAAETTGGTFIFPIAAMNNVAQGAAVMGTMVCTKDKKVKSICTASGVSAFLGITEPAMFGVTLKLRYPFYAAMIGSACGGAYIAATKTKALAMGTAGLIGFVSIDPKSWVNYFIGMAISIVVAFVVTIVLYKKFITPEENKKLALEAKAVESNVIYAPLKGEMKSVTECSDPMFASKAMGEGVVIIPSEGLLKSPVNGVITMVFPTNHAIGITSTEGTEILIHVGLDTVNLNGRPFKSLVEADQMVSVGQPLLEIDLDMIKNEGLSTETPVVITNQKEFDMIGSETIDYEDKIMKVK